jgi:hypothetical protein
LEVTGQLHAPATLAPGKESLVPIQQEAGWAPELVWTRCGEEKISQPLPGLEPLIIQPESQRYTTELTRLLNRAQDLYVTAFLLSKQVWIWEMPVFPTLTYDMEIFCFC